MRKLLPILVLVPCLAAAQAGVKLTFASPAPRLIWAAKSATEPPPPTPSTRELSVTVPSLGAGQFLCVLEEDTGNLAARAAKDVASGWQVVAKDFTRVGRVTVRIDQGGSPAPYASVSLGGQTRLIAPQSKGEATFYGVPLGDARVSVTFKENGGDMTQAQRFGIASERQDKVPTLVMVLAVGSTGATGSGGAGSTEKAPEKGSDTPKGALPKGSLFGQLVLILLVGAGALAGLIFGLKWIYSNQDTAKSALGKIGVQVPDPIAPDPAPVAPPVQIAPEPVSPIVLPGADLTPVAAPFVGASSSEPRLVGISGSFDLLEGVHVIGREAGLTIPLVGESTISRRHAEIVRQGDAIVVRDLGSTNGTFVNGTQITSDQALGRGDSVQFGSVKFRIE